MKKIALLGLLLAAAACASTATERGFAEIDTLVRNAVEQKRVPMAVAMAVRLFDPDRLRLPVFPQLLEVGLEGERGGGA